MAASEPASAALRCEAQINEALANMSIPQSDVKSIKVARQGKGAKSATNYSWDAWVRLNSCNGYVMVHMTRTCHVQQVYTTGDCKVDGMPRY
ncbi:hypothetical protein HBA54_13705 [Pelagibius litoralis]|uniref:Uncharacterized protein n=1 Tax=Pelagibius litoralis TaxID=374515 RepID=A0A967EY96_9PROT|nr:hypothetical protein [Pelagibius litoralis]NIA69652.1 hypothetical protein [Pelagibius litoralis]